MRSVHLTVPLCKQFACWSTILTLNNHDVVLRFHGSISSRLQLVSTSGQIDVVIMVGKRAGAAAARGRVGSGLGKPATAGSKRKAHAQDVLCTEHDNCNTTPRQAAAQSQSQQTMKSVRASLQQEVSSAGREPLSLLLQMPAFLNIIRLTVVCTVTCLTYIAGKQL